ncbi:MAG: single-stranded-DNA-specific exonuclease RecJ [Pseudomonadota bacterium]
MARNSAASPEAAPIYGAGEGVGLPPMLMPASGRRWVLAPGDPAVAAAIESALGCAPALARLLAARGVKAGDAARYLSPSLRDSLPDPSTLADMSRAASRLATAIVSGERCGVFGDYDVDGTSGSAILKGYFSAVGAPLDVYLPDRILEGYGPTIEAFRTLKDGGVRIVITVDCGAAAHTAVDAAASEGLEVIVLDHHQMDGPPPAGAYATVNPNRPDDRSGLTTLSAAGVAFMAIVAINRALKDEGYFAERPAPDLMRFLDLTALGLVCDVMPMTGLARILTAQGLKVLNSGGNPGLKALGERCGVSKKASAYDLGFLLGPRINAAGRIGHARLAFELLTTGDAARRAELADRLHVMNAERQQIEKDVQEAAIALVDRQRLYERSVIVAAGEGWHPGVIGIVAGRLKDRYDRPAIVIGIDGDTGKGSARSLSGVDIGAAFRAAKAEGLLLSGGGHAMAAGLTIAAGAIGAFTEFVDAACKDEVARALMNRVREIDGVIAPSAVSGAFASVIESAGPFGPGNPEPVFALASIRVERTRTVGEGHLSCDLVSATGERVRAIAFRSLGEPLGELLTGQERLHLAGRIKADNWRGNGAAQFHIVDAAKAPA